MAINHAGISGGFHGLLDWFIPVDLREKEEVHRRIRTFVISHIFGPPLGLVIAVYLISIEVHFTAWVLAAGSVLFAAFPLLLRATGAIDVLALLSILHFIFLILFASYQLGGVFSPALPWILTLPLVCVFFVEGRPRLFCLLTLLAGYMLIFVLHSVGHQFPQNLDIRQLGPVTFLSILCAALYVTTMALSYVDLYEFTFATLRDAKDRAESASRAKSEFLATMSHELRTPLNAIIGFSQMMSQEMLGPMQNDRYRTYAGDIEQSATHLLHIISDILDIAKIESGRFDISEEEVGIDSLTQEALEIVKPIADQANVSLAIRFSRHPFLIRADRRLLKQMILNLLSNAVKFSPPSSSVELTYGLDASGTALITVTDHGEGIPDEELERVLQPFEQVESADTRRHGGVGLGLPLTKRMAEVHGGEFTIASARGRGTTATIRLPSTRVLWRATSGEAEASRPTPAHLPPRSAAG